MSRFRDGGKFTRKQSEVFVLAVCGLLAVDPAMCDTSRYAPARTMRDVEASLKDCLQPFHEADGAQINVYFSVKRDGQIFGRPRVVWFGQHADGDDHAAILADFLHLFESCMPLRLSPRMAESIPGKVYYLQFKGSASGPQVMVRPYGSEGPPLIGDWWW